ncbi:ATP-binding protein [Tropicimonas sp. IMCC34011]|uniref:hybrid sensor histidine kinase/response regulator n=1 Tax=Tropicimonas sp. IMCC34011 TaxID=2248759 RepID=UPI001300B4BC|nr:ATP-binding protein [Tropicimonas sp. IMCC34011]
MKLPNLVTGLLPGAAEDAGDAPADPASLPSLPSSPSALLSVDQCGIVRSSNGVAEGLLELDSDEIVGRGLSDLLGVEDAAVLLGHSRAGSGPIQIRTEARLGTRVTLDAQSDDLGVAGTALSLRISDVTPDRRSARELRLAGALEAGGVGVFEVDIASDKSVVTPRWLELLGFDIAHGAALDAQAEWLARVHPDDSARVAASDAACYAGETDLTDTTYRFLRPDGRWMWTRSISVVSERDRRGNPQRLTGLQFDMDEHFRLQDQLSASQRRFRESLGNSPFPTALCSVNGDIIDANIAFCDLVGFPHSEIIGVTLLSLSFPDNAEAARIRMDSLKRGTVRRYETEKRIRRKDGSGCWARLSVSYDPGTEGMDGIIVAQARDISRDKELDEAKAQFLATVSHELRTPLTSVHGAIRLLSQLCVGENQADGVMRLLSIAETNSKRLIDMVNDILDVERLTAPDTVFDFEPSRIADIAREAVESVTAAAISKNIRVTITEEAEGKAMVDAMRLGKAMEAILSNAIKFSDPDSDVILRVSSDEYHVTVWVEDTGCGIPVSFRDKVFDRFTQADSSSTREQGGSGIGLYVSNLAVIRMGGRIGFESEEGVGSKFWIRLPRIDNAGTKTSPQVKSSLPSILHVEPESGFGDIFRSALKGKADYIRAGSFAAAVRLLDSYSFDVIIVDWDLPDGNGRDILDFVGEPPPVILGFSNSETAWSDPRVTRNLVKTRASIDDILSLALKSA